MHASVERRSREARETKAAARERVMRVFNARRKTDRSLRCSRSTHRLNGGLVSATQARRTGYYKGKVLVFSRNFP